MHLERSELICDVGHRPKLRIKLRCVLAGCRGNLHAQDYLVRRRCRRVGVDRRQRHRRAGWVSRCASNNAVILDRVYRVGRDDRDICP
jgi:hypothetical protein